MMEVSIREAARQLGLTQAALKQRVLRAKKTTRAFETVADLGHGVRAVMPTFSKRWIIIIPKKLADKIAKGVKGAKGTKGKQ
jgi:hypothetical protein